MSALFLTVAKAAATDPDAALSRAMDAYRSDSQYVVEPGPLNFLATALVEIGLAEDFYAEYHCTTYLSEIRDYTRYINSTRLPDLSPGDIEYLKKAAQTIEGSRKKFYVESR